METTINIAKRKEALKILKNFKDNIYQNSIVEIENIRLKNINKFFKSTIITRSNCFIESKTLWEIMQPIGNKKSHNFHGLTEEMVFDALNSLSNPIDAKPSYYGRFLIITIAVEEHGHNLGAIIEPNIYNITLDKTINKIITIHPLDLKNKKM